MTFFSPPIAPPVDLTAARRATVHIERAAPEPTHVPAWALTLDFVDRTNGSWAAKDSASGVHVGELLTNDGTFWPASAAPDDPALWLSELRQRTDLSYAEVARLIGVERRTLYFWLEGRAISDENRGRLAALVADARRLEARDAATTGALLRAALPTVEAPPRADRLAGHRLREGDPSARLPALHPAILMSSGDPVSGDEQSEPERP